MCILVVWCIVMRLCVEFAPFRHNASEVCDCLQEQTEQMEKEKEELRQEVEQLKEGEQILKNELDGRLEEIHRLRVSAFILMVLLITIMNVSYC